MLLPNPSPFLEQFLLTKLSQREVKDWLQTYARPYRELMSLVSRNCSRKGLGLGSSKARPSSHGPPEGRDLSFGKRCLSIPETFTYYPL